MSTTDWKRTVRAWAREQQATHAVIAGCGAETRLTIGACLGRIAAVHCGVDAGSVIADVHGNQVRVRRPGGKALAILHDPTRREPDGYDPDTGRQRWRHIRTERPTP
ncbi:hypothetical protein MYK68_14140 [Gordonia sp. PP30]|uniref:hypothetical protein n=1 Tax=Gordonia sp. PP30 TaxID=2935861 RepID=UPI001FFF1419|nr:hypothetical protein [Gordonia sp. PP30]UQE73871.1 hypothetical protein MYK68_14140 [Gordonia sp. PP30]